MNLKTKYYKQDGRYYRKYENEYIHYFVDYYDYAISTDILTRSGVLIRESFDNNISNLIKYDILFIIKYMRENK